MKKISALPATLVLLSVVIAGGCSYVGAGVNQQNSQGVLAQSRNCNAAGAGLGKFSGEGTVPDCVVQLAKTLDPNVSNHMTYEGSQTSFEGGFTTDTYGGIDPTLRRCESFKYTYTPQIQSRQTTGFAYEIDIVGSTNNQCG